MHNNNNNYGIEMYEHNPQDEAPQGEVNLINLINNYLQDPARPINNNYLQGPARPINNDLQYAYNLIDEQLPPSYKPIFNYSPSTLHRLDSVFGGMTAISALACVNGVAGLVDGRDRTASIGLAATGFVGCLTGLRYHSIRARDIAGQEEWMQSAQNFLARPGGGDLGR